MKKIVLVGLLALIGLTGFRTQAQIVGCNDTVFWGMPLSFDTTECCWTVLEGPTDCFYANFDGIVCNYDTLADHRFLSPWIEIPAMAATESVFLLYSTYAFCPADYSVAITTNGVTYDTLRRRLAENSQLDTLLLGAYAGQVVRLEFCHYGLNSTYDAYASGCAYAADYDWHLFFEALQWIINVYPWATCTVPTKTYVGDTTWLWAALAAGSHTGLTYTWHSSLTGQTWTGDTVPVVYTIGGRDTITLVVSNAFGSDTLVRTVTVIDCPDVITAHPWKADFKADFDCWRTVGTVGWSSASRTISSVTTDGISAAHNSGGANIIASPAVALPVDSTGLRLYWKDSRVSSSAATYYVLVSTTDRFDIAAYDTIFTSTSQTSGLTQRSVSLADYAGDTIYIAFSKKLQSGRTVYITDVQMYNALAPIGVMGVPDFAIVGDMTNFTVAISQGDTLGLTVTLHSALKDSSWAMNADAWGDGSYWLDLVYDTPGEETVTVTASNAQGTLVLSAIFSIFACDTIRTFPWEEDFSDADGSYNACWTINGYSHAFGYTIRDEETNVAWQMTNTMKATIAGSYMIVPPITIPAGETNIAFMVEYARGSMDIRVSPTASTDTALFTDLLFTEPTANYIKRRWVNLGAYAGQTIRVALVTTNPNNIQHVNRVWVGLDTLPYIGLHVSVPTELHNDSTALCTVNLMHGSTDGLHYTWTSKVGGIIITNALGDSAWVNYSAGFSSTEDTITVIATNDYGADTVAKPLYIIDCSPALTLPWKETFADGDVCWYIPEGSNWHAASSYSNTYLYLQTRTDTLGSWIISKEIHIPADTNLIPRLFWDVASSSANYQHLYNVLVTTAVDYTDTTNYTILYTDSSTHVNYSSYDHRNVDLTPYAGQTIHVAFHNNPWHLASSSIGLYIDNVGIRTTHIPVISLSAPTLPNSHEPVTFTITLCEGNTAGMTYTWHSTLMDSTMVTTVPTLTMAYTVGGTDTIVVIAMNAYGADTASTMVTVTDCTPITLPWTEDFDALLGTSIGTEGPLPDCWHCYGNGTGADRPHVIGSYSINPVSSYFTSGQQALVLLAGTPNVYIPEIDSVSIVESPKIAGDLNGKRLSFYYMHESANYGQLSVGYMQDSVFVTVADLPRQQTGQTVNLLLDSIPASVNRVALQWKKVGTWYGVIVDNVRLSAFDSVPTVAIATPQYVDGDSILFRAYLIDGLSDSLTYSWQSTMATAGQAILTTVGDSAYIVYTAPGTDTVSVIATNAYGVDTAWVPFTYNGTPIGTFTGPSAVNTDDTITYAAYLFTGSTTGVSFSWQSTMAAAGHATMVVTGDTLRMVYLDGGTDTLTLITTNAFGVDTTRRYITVTNCHITTFPWTEGFESGVSPCWHLSTIPGSTTTNWSIRGEYWYAHSGSHYMYSPFATADGDNGSIDAWFILPPVEVPAASSLSLNFYANFQGNSTTHTYPRLTVLVSTSGSATNNFTDTIYSEQTNTLDREYLFGSASLAAYAGQTVWIAFVHGNRYVSLGIDDISIDYSAVPVAGISGPTEQLSSEEAIFTAHLLNGDTTGITYIWHSTMADAGLATLTATDSTAAIEYHAGGTDHVSVVIANAAGSDSVAMTCSVTDCEPITQLPYTVRLNSSNNITCWQRGGWYIGDYFSSGITCMQYWNWDYDPVDSWLVMREIAIPDDYTQSYTLRWHMQCNHSKYQVMVSTQGRSSHSLFDTLYYEQNDSTNWTSRTLSLDAYRGQNIYIAFRNLGWYNSPTHYADGGVIRIDTIQVLLSPDTHTYHTLTLNVNDATMGTVSGAGVYPDSSDVTISATPFEGYHFVAWNDGNTLAIRTITVVSDTAFIAHFAADSLPTPPPDTVWRTVSVTANVEGACETYGSGLYVDSSTVEIGYHVLDTVAEGGYWQFLGWNDGGVGNPRNILVTSDTAIVALFEWVADSVGIGEIESSKLRIEIYPNPTSGDVTVEITSDLPLPTSELTVLDMTGRVVIPPTPITSKLRLQTSDLPSGVYFVRVGSTVKKLVVK